jgi:uncharacterized membrane protein (UPF0127 family)
MILLTLLLLFSGCFQETAQQQSPVKFSHVQAQLKHQDEQFTTLLAISPSEQAQGLSGVASADWPQNYSMLFVGEQITPRSFWMPDTYFDLDIFFLDGDLTVIYVAREMPHHPSHQEPPAIARTPVIQAQHVLEIRSSDPLAKKINLGARLQWLGPGKLPGK